MIEEDTQTDRTTNHNNCNSNHHHSPFQFHSDILFLISFYREETKETRSMILGGRLIHSTQQSWQPPLNRLKGYSPPFPTTDLNAGPPFVVCCVRLICCVASPASHPIWALGPDLSANPMAYQMQASQWATRAKADMRRMRTAAPYSE